MAPSIWMFLIPFLWIGGFVAASIFVRRSKGKPVFPKIDPHAQFGERGCSGRSLRGLVSKIGGAHNCLLVTVRAERLIVTPQFPFNLMFLPEIYGLDLDVSTRSIATITPVKILFKNALRIDFENGGPAPIEVVLHDEAGFAAAIGRQVVIPGSRTISAPTRKKRRIGFVFARVFFTIWGSGALYAAVTGLQQDWQFRKNGQTATATFVAPNEQIDNQVEMGVLTYHVGRSMYRVTSISGNGLYSVGEKETLYYFVNDPQNARESSYLGFDLLWLALGTVALSVSIFGGMAARRIW